MALRNTADNFGTVSKLLHAVMAVLVIGLLCVGLYMTGLKPGADMLKLYGLHKSIGICVLALAALRLVWVLSNPRPALLGPDVTWERHLAKTVHVLLYVAMFAMPLSGWLMSSAKGYSVSVFGLFTLPDMIAPDKASGELFEEFHEIAAWVLIVTIVMHAGGALKHHFVYKDATMKRMFRPCHAPEGADAPATETKEAEDDAA